MKTSYIFISVSALILIVLILLDAIGFLGLIFFWFLMIVIGVQLYKSEKNKERKKVKEFNHYELNNLEGFTATKELVGHWGYIAIDDDSEQLTIKNRMDDTKTYKYSEILGSEILEDGKIVYRKSSVIGRAIVGGIIAGNAGAILGGLSGKEKESKEIKNLDLKIIVKDTNNPNIIIRIFDAWEDTDRSKKSISINNLSYGQILVAALKNLENWKDTIEVIIDKQDSKSIENNRATIPSSDELLKLYNLKEKGVLTKEEFERLKKNILS